MKDLEASAWYLYRVLEDLLFWGKIPDPDPLSDGWLDAYKTEVGRRVESVLSANVLNDHSISQKAKDARRIAFEFATIMQSDHKLSSVPVRHWTLKAEQRTFDELDQLAQEFKKLGQIANDDVTLPEKEPDELDLVTIPEIAKFVDLQRNSMTPYTKKWGNPFRAHAGSGKPALYLYAIIRPKLTADWPHLNWPITWNKNQ